MFKELISKVALKLKKNGISYMIIGGQAVLLYGEPRLTRDIDITLGLSPESFEKILSIANELSLKPLPANLEQFVKETMVLPVLDEISNIRIDFIFSLTFYEMNAIKRAKKIVLEGEEVCFSAPEDLIIHKIFSGRAIDLEDVRNILLKNPDIDKDYIINCLKEFDKTLEKKEFLKIFGGVLKEI